MSDLQINVPVYDYREEMKLIADILQFLLNNQRNIPKSTIEAKLVDLKRRIER